MTTFSSCCLDPFLVLFQKLLIRKGSHCFIGNESSLLSKLTEHTVLADILAIFEVGLKQLLLQGMLISVARSIRQQYVGLLGGDDPSLSTVIKLEALPAWFSRQR